MHKSLIISIFLLLAVAVSYGQSMKKLLKQGSKHYKRGEINLALEYYLEAEKLEPGNVELNLHIGRAYLLSDYKYHALPYLSKVYKLNPSLDPDIQYYLGIACQHNYLFEEAIQHYKTYGEQRRLNRMPVDQKIKECQHADSLILNPVAVDIENLGALMNSPAHDYAPIITPDESVLVFTSRREGSTGGKRTKDNEFYEDIYISYRKNGDWTAPRQISKNINFEYHDAAAAISADGRELYMYMEEGGGDLYRSVFDGREWGKPQSLGAPINTEYWETSVSMSPDGKKLYFSSDRPGGFGGLDIYVSERQSNGNWGEPRNLGPDINTFKDEDSPYIHPDGQTLYFSSSGHPGLGGFDVFKSEWSGQEWEQPENMGYPINTPDDNFHFIMSGDRAHAYYTSIQEGGVGKADIYRISFLDVTLKPILETARKEREAAKARLAVKKDSLEAAAHYSGKAIDAESGQPLEANIVVSHLLTGELVAETRSLPDGSFSILIPEAGNYGLSAEVKGYMIISRKLKISSQTKQQQLEAMLRLYPLQVGSTSIMSNIFFDFGKASLQTESITELDKIRDFLNNSPTLKIQVNGHTDNVGNAYYNKILSRKRAQSVVDYLVQNGIDSNRLAIMGFGQERPLVSNDDEEEGRELNRRTEIEVLSF